jgi:hypothetical protein
LSINRELGLLPTCDLKAHGESEEVGSAMFHQGLFFLDARAKQIYYIDPRVDREQPNEDETYFNATKTSLSRFFGLKEFDMNAYSVELFPSQYFCQHDETLPTDLEILLILYFLEADVPIWYDNAILSQITLRFLSYLLRGSIPY